MEPQEYFAVLRRRWILIVAATLLCAVGGLGYASTLPKLFKATGSVFVASQRGETSSELVQGSTFTQAQVQSLSQLASLPAVLQPVIERLDLGVTPEELAPSVSSDIRLNTVIIDVTVSSAVPEDAAAIANAITVSLADVADGLYSESAISMRRVGAAEVPTSTYSPNTRFIVATGALIGLVLAISYALGREILDTRVRGARDLERVTKSAILGSVARWKLKNKTPIVMLSDPFSPESEDIRRVATNIEFSDLDQPIRAALVTSGSPGEGKTSLAINLALALAERYARVLLIDADLRKPSVADYCGIEGIVGLTSVLVGSATLEEAIRPWAGGVIDVLPSGRVPYNPAQVLGSETMANVLEEVRARYDFVLLDTAPILPVTDSLILASLVDGSIVVARFKKTRRQQLAGTIDSLAGVNARLLGVVLNGVNPLKQEPYYTFRDDEASASALSLAADFSRIDERVILDSPSESSEVPTPSEPSRAPETEDPEAADLTNGKHRLLQPLDEVDVAIVSSGAESTTPGPTNTITTRRKTYVTKSRS